MEALGRVIRTKPLTQGPRRQLVGLYGACEQQLRGAVEELCKIATQAAARITDKYPRTAPTVPGSPKLPPIGIPDAPKLPSDKAPIVELALETGLDRGELLLNWDRHIDRDRQLIIAARGKTGVGRSIPYGSNKRIRRILKDADRVRHPSRALFLDRDGQPIKLEALKTAMRRAWAAAKLTKTRPWKTLRATFATRKAEAGVPVPVLAELMGLTSSHVLQHYVKPSGLHLAEAMADGDDAGLSTVKVSTG